MNALMVVYEANVDFSCSSVNRVVNEISYRVREVIAESREDLSDPLVVRWEFFGAVDLYERCVHGLLTVRSGVLDVSRSRVN
jgi:hypothetical protein